MLQNTTVFPADRRASSVSSAAASHEHQCHGITPAHDTQQKTQENRTKIGAGAAVDADKLVLDLRCGRVHARHGDYGHVRAQLLQPRKGVLGFRVSGS